MFVIHGDISRAADVDPPWAQHKKPVSERQCMPRVFHNADTAVRPRIYAVQGYSCSGLKPPHQARDFLRRARACLKTPFRRIFGAFSAIRRQRQTCEPLRVRGVCHFLV